MPTNKQRTRETLFNHKRITYQRVRVCLEIDVPEEEFVRDHVNSTVLSLKSHLENEQRGWNVVLVTTEDA